MKREITIQRKL